MIEIDGEMLPNSSEEASAEADRIEAIIEAARDKVIQAQVELTKVCMEQYRVGMRVAVLVAARRDPVHRIIAVNEHGWATLKNVYTGTERTMSIDSHCIRPSRSWYERYEKGKTA